MIGKEGTSLFGYVNIASNGLSAEEQNTYRAYYCGLCHTIGQRFGTASRLTLSYDLTFLYLLLSSLYEPESVNRTARCLPHPLHEHSFIVNEYAEYCADMNLILACYKCADDRLDEKKLLPAAEDLLLRSAFQQARERYPEKCRQIEQCLQRTHELEASGTDSPDLLANETARMLGCVYRYREDFWSDCLSQMGESLGRFIYLMDAYEDLEQDQKSGSFNPLRSLSHQEDYEELISRSLNLFMGECTEAFELLPIVKNAGLLRNVLYAGCWQKYTVIRSEHDRKNGIPVERKGGGA